MAKPKPTKGQTGDNEEMKTANNALPMPIFTPVMPPQMVRSSHAALVKWRKERLQYKETMRNRVLAAGGDIDMAMVPIKSTLDKRLLAMWRKLRWKMEEEVVTDKHIWDEVERIITTAKHDTLPNIEVLFKDDLKMDLSKSDVSERVLQYFEKCYDVIDEHSLGACFEDNRGSKEEGKLLIAYLEPVDLRDAVNRSIQYQKQAAKEDETLLHDQIQE
ncbi:hypothetical protein PHMEG_0006245 [Phytophthora megakarya]|uniref:Uncharacterized protein n=1 Tax=Phytophthora megakarya TaxID=4795 RepID=A0A225WRC8_9STRA|nr:hypothetical protein PHMEG_0006245 [Phytophthora megakarya]